MRTDENGNECPSTLGEYREAVVALVGENNVAVAFLDRKIAEQGPNMEVLAPDSQMRYLLFPLMMRRRTDTDHPVATG